MRIKNLDVGVERITQWNIGDEAHLPVEGKAAPAFLPQHRPLDAILRRPSLDERLPDLIEPADLDPELLDPNALADTRRELRQLFMRQAARGGQDSTTFADAADLLDTDEALEEEIRQALALLLRA